MKKLFILPGFATLAAGIWPIPSSMTTGNSTFWIDSDVPISYTGSIHVGAVQNQQEPIDYQQPNYTYNDSAAIASEIIRFAIAQTQRTLFEQSFVPWKFHPRNSNFEPSTSDRRYISSINLQQIGEDPSNIYAAQDGDVDESYTLSLTDSGDVTIAGNTSIGISRGLVTFTQLFYAHSAGGVYTPNAPVSIQDAPKFAHRGLNMDLSRNYFPIHDICRMIDALAYNKFNRFHLHITDGQSWPLVVPALPELAAKGAYRADLVYTPDDVKAIQLHGARQGVQVYLEIDMPGHTSSIAYAYPDLIASFNNQPDWSTYAAEPPSGTLKLNSSAVSDFIQILFDDVLPRVKSYTTYWHTGGDEVNVNAYLNDETVQSNDPEAIQPHMQRFLDHNHDIVRKAGLIPVVWEEMLLQWDLTLGSDVIVQTWQSDDAVAQTVAKGHKALVGNYNYWYLDCGQGQWLNFVPGRSSEQFWPYADYCSPRKNWRLMYSYDPLSGVPAAKQHLVLGGECHIWAEQTDPVSLDRMVWPRTAAAAEILWSGAKDGSGNNRSQIAAAPRLSEMRERLVAKGIAAEPIQMPFCLMEPDQCSL